MVRRTDRPLRIVRVSFETTRFSAQHLIDAYTAVVPMVRRIHLRAPREKAGPPEVPVMTAKRRRGEA
jgi:hypothetical protein